MDFKESNPFLLRFFFCVFKSAIPNGESGFFDIMDITVILLVSWCIMQLIGHWNYYPVCSCCSDVIVGFKMLQVLTNLKWLCRIGSSLKTARHKNLPLASSRYLFYSINPVYRLNSAYFRDRIRSRWRLQPTQVKVRRITQDMQLASSNRLSSSPWRLLFRQRDSGGINLWIPSEFTAVRQKNVDGINSFI